MPIIGRNYYLGSSGQRETFNDNKSAFRKIKIIPKVLRDVSKYCTKVTVLGTEIDYPIGFSPVGLLKLAHPEGDLALVAGLKNWNTILIMSSYATNTIEDVAERAKGSSLQLWMQTYFFKNFTTTMDIINRAEKNGFKALVVSADTNVNPTETCGARSGLVLPPDVEVINVGQNYKTAIASNATFNDIVYIRSRTRLPIVAKGILSASDAIRAIQAGASAILVSNHGGRQMDYSPATIDALPFIVDTVKEYYPHIEIYVDGGIRNGYDIYKALARGAKMVFLGRPSIWGIAFNGSSGVNQVMDIITSEFQEVMTLSGHTDPNQITRDSLLPQLPTF
ncbi:2-Hydroxyacid oxidase 1 isoform X2 [Parasteatoda tepidariorum]